jgi:hypothetical protein
MRLDLYKESKEKQESGSPCYLGDGSFNVKRLHTPEYNKQIDDIKKNEYGFAPKDVDTNLILATWLAEYGVTGWDGVLDSDDKSLKFTRKNARKVFLNPEYFLSLNAILIQHASDYNNYLHDEILEDVEAVKKN